MSNSIFGCIAAGITEDFEGLNQNTDKQVNLILTIAKYHFKWGRKAIFNYCWKSCPDMQVGDIKNYSTGKLFKRMTTDQKSHVIKRLLQIQKNNTAKQELENL